MHTIDTRSTVASYSGSICVWRKPAIYRLLVILVIALAVGGVAQPPKPREVRIAFARGATSATVKGKLQGEETVDYLVRAAAGQTLSVKMAPDNRSAYFNVLPPGSKDAAMYNGQSGEPYKGRLPDDGDYLVRVYLVRAAARRNEASSYALTVGVTGQPLAPLPASQDATVGKTRYHASGTLTGVPSPYGKAAREECEAGVVRRKDASATVEIQLGQGRVRRILFVAGKPVAADTSATWKATSKGDTTIIKFEDGELWEIPAVFIQGD